MTGLARRLRGHTLHDARDGLDRALNINSERGDGHALLRYGGLELLQTLLDEAEVFLSAATIHFSTASTRSF